MELLTPVDVQRLLDEYDLAPRKSSGQNFVVDPNTVRKIVRDAGLPDGVTVLEIGPGLGSLTRALLEVAGRVVAVEIDAGFVRLLEDTLGDQPGLRLIHADALEADLGVLVEGGPARLVSNLPYNVATPLVMHALESGAFEELYVMVQREVGERWAARPGEDLYAGVSVKLALLADVEVTSSVSRQIFWPVPNVDSVMVRITPRTDGPSLHDWARMREVVDASFAHRRKTMRNNLKVVVPVDLVVAACEAAEIDPSLRAEQLTAEDFRRLAAALPDVPTP